VARRNRHLEQQPLHPLDSKGYANQEKHPAKVYCSLDLATLLAARRNPRLAVNLAAERRQRQSIPTRNGTITPGTCIGKSFPNIRRLQPVL
jgi:hypothetical protein